MNRQTGAAERHFRWRRASYFGGKQAELRQVKLLPELLLQLFCQQLVKDLLGDVFSVDLELLSTLGLQKFHLIRVQMFPEI